MTRIGALLTGATLLAGAVTAGETTLTRVDIDRRLYPLLSDLDADGVPEVLLLTREVRRSSDGAEQVRTRIALLEPLPAGASHGLRIEGRRYGFVPGARRDLIGVEPPAGFPGGSLEGSIQARYGMYSLLVLPLRDVVTGRSVPVAVYNHRRGSFRIGIGEISLALVDDLPARAHMAAVLGVTPAPAGAGTSLALRAPR